MRARSAPVAAKSTKPTLAGQDRIPGLDLLRLFAAFAVVVFHFGYGNAVLSPPMAVTSFPELSYATRYGFLGVDLFFLISGFVIAATAEGRSAIDFAIARAGRLYPAFLVCMTATALVIALAGMPPHSVSFGQWLANLTMWAHKLGSSHIDGVYWTIVLELVFYGWVALLIALGLYQRRPLTIIAAWLAICFLAEIMIETKSLRTPLLTEYGALFASGMLIHRIHRGIAGVTEWAMLAFAFLLSGLHAIDMQIHFAQHYATHLDMNTLWLLHVGIYALFALTLWASRFIPSTTFVLACGGITYPLYLLHQTAGAIVLDRLSPVIGRWAALAVVLVLAFAASWAVWRYVEPAGRRILTRTLRNIIDRASALVSQSRPLPQ